MTRLGSDIVYEFLEVAVDLAASELGTATRQNARRRRAVSSAYYALFHAFSSLCADTLAGDHRDEMIVDLLYRALDHGELGQALRSQEAMQIAPSVALIERAFRNLLERRQAADYAATSHFVLPHEALNLVGLAKEAITSLEQLNPNERLRLAVLLLAKSRPRQIRR